jgi:hypothetical protein
LVEVMVMGLQRVAVTVRVRVMGWAVVEQLMAKGWPKAAVMVMVMGL